MCLLQDLADVRAVGVGGWGWEWDGVEVCGNFSFGVSESLLPILEEEGLQDGVLSPEAFSPGL